MTTFVVVHAGRVQNVVERDDVADLRREPGIDLVLGLAAFAERPNVGDVVHRLQTGVPPFFTTMAPVLRAPDLLNAQRLATARINRECGAYRGLFLTDITGQMRAYEDKEREVRAYDAVVASLAVPADADYPYMSGNAVLTGRSVKQVRDEIKGRMNILLPLSAKIENARDGFTHRVEVATSLDEIAAVFPLHWPTP